MARECQVTGKRVRMGRSYSLRGIAKKKKGIGLKITGISKRKFEPNLFKKRLWFDEENRFVTLRLSAHGLKTVEKLGLAAVIKKMRKEGRKV